MRLTLTAAQQAQTRPSMWEAQHACPQYGVGQVDGGIPQ